MFGYHGLVVEITEVAEYKAQSTPQRKPSINQGEMTAAAFARSAGIRGKGQFLALIEGGYTPAMLVFESYDQASVMAHEPRRHRYV
nr:hypothetical protein [Tropicimonas sp. IMCC34011]